MSPARSIGFPYADDSGMRCPTDAIIHGNQTASVGAINTDAADSEWLGAWEQQGTGGLRGGVRGDVANPALVTYLKRHGIKGP
jgi:hypothetical protein